MTMGAPLSASPGRASISKRASAARPFAVTMTPSSRNTSETPTAASSTPPGLLRKSSTSPVNAAPFFFFRAASERSRSGVVVSLKCEMRT
jgi:hypothetical protein